jgi:hypothetical protein
VLFLKVTRSVKRFAARFGWLMAELIFVFLGMYGAFLLERMHDDDMDLLRKRQILQALVDEFEDYETELGSASSSLDEAYGVPFFTSYGAGERPFPTPIPYGGMGSVNTGIWEAMLQSGGIEVLEVEVIQQVQVFFKKLQDLLDLYSRFERLTEQMILPEMDQEVNYFYQTEGSELRDKYKWYVNSLFTIGMSLRSLSEQAAATKVVLLAEYEKIREKDEKEKKNYAPAVELPLEPKPEEIIEEPMEDSVEASSDARSQALDYLSFQCQALAEHLQQIKTGYDETYAIPFFTSYSEGECPVPFPIPMDLLEGITVEPFSDLLAAEGVEEVLEKEILDSLRNILEKISDAERVHQEFAERCELEIMADQNTSLFYATEAIEVKEKFQWFPNSLYGLGIALEGSFNETSTVLTMLKQEGAPEALLEVADSSVAEPVEQSIDLILETNQTTLTEDEN